MHVGGVHLWNVIAIWLTKEIWSFGNAGVLHIQREMESLSKVTNYEMSMFGSVIWNKVD